jgi:hypothetical protein
MALRHAALMVVLVLVAGAAGADQTREQQRCLNDLYKRVGSVLTARYRSDHACLKRVAREKPCQDGGSGRLARQIDKLVSSEAARCTDEGEQPDFGHRAGPETAAAAAEEGATVAAALLGDDLAAAVLQADDRDGARCQALILKRTGKLMDRLWREARRGATAGLDGSIRTWGPNPSGPLDDAYELEAEMRAQVAADPKGRIAKATDALARDAERKCGATATPLADLFPGCAAQTPTELAACAERIAHRALYGTMASALGLDVSCDLTDDGAANDTCIPPALEQHVLGRLGYDPDPWSRARLEQLGVRGYIEEQLDSGSIAENPDLEALLAQLPSLEMSFRELRATYQPNPPDGVLPLGQILRELQGAKVARAILSHRQLEQVLTDFWFNHFNVGVTSRRQKYDISPYERIAIRPHVLGRFRDLALAVARSPAMGDFLDNRRSKVGEINENFGREFLELHTLGVTAPYTETDVVESARCFTGWREDYDAPDGFRFEADWHDENPKSLLGGDLVLGPNGGEQDGIDLVDFVAAREETARQIATKLAIRFVSESPPPGLIDRAVDSYLSSDGDIRAMLETMLLSPEFLEWPYVRETKVKRPLHLMASLARTTGTTVTLELLNSLRRRSRDLGEDPYRFGSPAGLPDVSAFWSSPGALMVRFNEIERAARRQRRFDFAYPPLGPSSAEVVDGLIAHFFVAPTSVDTRDVAVAYLDVLAEPDPTKQAEQAAAVLLSSPEFLLH